MSRIEQWEDTGDDARQLQLINAVTRFTATKGGRVVLKKSRWSHAFMVVGLLVGMQGCAEMSGTSPQRMINANDHVGLANYYAKQAQELREKAKQWEFTAEYYDKHSEPHGKTEPAQHAAHCRAIAQNYKKAAEEAEALAQEHRAMRPHGMIQ